MSQPEPARERVLEILEVEGQTHRRTGLIQVIDLRGLTFTDASGIRGLIRQKDNAQLNRQNLAVVRGRSAIERLLALTAVEELLVLVDDPEDLVPPPSSPHGSSDSRISRLEAENRGER
jgi:anti-anti-sigma regulatory factor